MFEFKYIGADVMLNLQFNIIIVVSGDPDQKFNTKTRPS